MRRGLMTYATSNQLNISHFYDPRQLAYYLTGRALRHLGPNLRDSSSWIELHGSSFMYIFTILD